MFCEVISVCFCQVNMSNHHNILLQYENDIKNLRDCGRKLDLNDKQIDELFKECFKIIEKKSKPFCKDNMRHNYLTILIKYFTLFLLSCAVIYVLLNVHQPTSSIVLRNVQSLIYPGFKFLRFFSVPIIKRYPSLTNYYDESCLLENPYFYVSDMECWPCENVHTVIDLTGFQNHSLYSTGIPYVTETNQKLVTFRDLRTTYSSNRQHFNNVDLNQNLSSDSHILWRINKMVPGRIIRKLFPRPHIISEWSGQSIERFVVIDGYKSAPHPLPNPECSYSFLIQASGERIIILKPSRECGDKCRTVSVLLKESYLLWYNWWYWRPISLPSGNSTTPSISYFSSYC